MSEESEPTGLRTKRKAVPKRKKKSPVPRKKAPGAEVIRLFEECREKIQSLGPGTSQAALSILPFMDVPTEFFCPVLTKEGLSDFPPYKDVLAYYRVMAEFYYKAQLLLDLADYSDSGELHRGFSTVMEDALRQISSSDLSSSVKSIVIPGLAFLYQNFTEQRTLTAAYLLVAASEGSYPGLRNALEELFLVADRLFYLRLFGDGKTYLRSDTGDPRFTRDPAAEKICNGVITAHLSAVEVWDGMMH